MEGSATEPQAPEGSDRVDAAQMRTICARLAERAVRTQPGATQAGHAWQAPVAPGARARLDVFVHGGLDTTRAVAEAWEAMMEERGLARQGREVAGAAFYGLDVPDVEGPEWLSDEAVAQAVAQAAAQTAR